MASDHPRNTTAMRRGTLCQAPAVAGKMRCRMHGGASGSGAPKGNKNALKHGASTAEARQRRAHLRQLIKDANNLARELG